MPDVGLRPLSKAATQFDGTARDLCDFLPMRERGAMFGLRGKDRKRTALRDERAGYFDSGGTKRDTDKSDVAPGDDIPEGLRRKPKGAPNKGFRRGEPAKQVPQNE
jgi:hypothetical protein